MDLISKYLDALQFEIANLYKGEFLETLYIGGGTPSVLTAEQISEIISLFNLNKKSEITIELNPDDVTLKYLQDLKNIGINRLSFGCQTFDDKILKLINRRHTSRQVSQVVKDALSVGFDNISLDLIYGLPTQTLDGFISDINHAVGLNVSHISLYGLKIEEGSYFYNDLPDDLPDDDLQADIYITAVKYLEKLGYYQYEISNFAIKNFYSRHNLNYWENNEYYGFGVAAHGYQKNVRYGNLEELEDYILTPLKKSEVRSVSKQEKLEEEIFLGFRKSAGINVKLINSKYSIDFENKYEKILSKYVKLNLLRKTKNGYKLTTEGVLVSNVVLADFIDV